MVTKDGLTLPPLSRGLHKQQQMGRAEVPALSLCKNLGDFDASAQPTPGQDLSPLQAYLLLASEEQRKEGTNPSLSPLTTTLHLDFRIELMSCVPI